MPIQLRDYSSLITSPEIQSPYRGNLGDSMRQKMRDNDARAENEGRLALDQEREKRLGQDQLEDQGIQRSRLAIEQGRFQQGLDKEADELFQTTRDTWYQGDPQAMGLWEQEMKRKGYEVTLPESSADITAQPGAAPATPAAVPDAPPVKPGETTVPPASPQAKPGDLALEKELGAMESGILSGLSGKPVESKSAAASAAPSAARATANRRVAELQLAPGDSLLGSTISDPRAVGGSNQGGAGAQAAPAAVGGKTGIDSGIEAPTIKQAPAAQGPKRLQIKKNGQVIYEVDPAQLDAQRRKVITDTFAPLAKTGNDIQTTAARKAMESAMGQLGTMPMAKLIASAMDQYEKEVDQLMGERRAAATRTGQVGGAPGFGGTGMTKTEYAVTGDTVELVERQVQRAQQNFGYKGLNDIEASANRVVAAIDEKSGVGDLMAITAAIAALQQRVTDADMRQALQAGGLESSISNFLGFALDKGRKDPAYMRQFRSVALNMAAKAGMTKKKAADETAATVRDLGTLHGWDEDKVGNASNAAYNALLGGSSARRSVGAGAPKGGRGGRPGNAPPKAPAAGGVTQKSGGAAQKWGLKLNMGGRGGS